MVVYRNEAKVITDSFKYEFRKKYKNLDLEIYIGDKNNLVDVVVMHFIDNLAHRAISYNINVIKLDGSLYQELDLTVGRCLTDIINYNYRR